MEMKVYKVAEADGKCYKCGKHVMRDCECFFGRLFLDNITNGNKKEDYPRIFKLSEQMIKKRSPKDDDQEKTEKAFQLLRKTILDNPQIEPTLWAGACWSVLVSGYINSGLTYEEFVDEVKGVKKFYKKHWQDNHE
jgi:hypothetical protein